MLKSANTELLTEPNTEYCIVRNFNKYTKILLHNTIQSSISKYIDFLDILYNSVEDEYIYLEINSPGGDVWTSIQLINSIREAAAHTICFVSGIAASAAAIIALSGNALVLKTNSYLMFHNYSGTNDGKGNSLTQAIEADNYQYKNLLITTCTPFLLEEEVAAIINDKDIYIHYNTSSLKKRIKRHYK